MSGTAAAERRLFEDTAAIEKVEVTLRANGKGNIQDQDIAAFFPELTREQIAHTTNIPAGVLLRHYLLLGYAPVLDLKPSTAKQFEATHQIDVAAIQELAERNLIRLNLYTRNPAEWDEAQQMDGLIARSFVIGNRVDAFMKWRAPDYDRFVEQHRRVISEAVSNEVLNDSDAHEIIQRAKVRKLSEVVAVVATRWAYLDVLDPLAATSAAEHFDKVSLRQFISYLNIQKHLSASHITAAIGGQFVAGPADFQVVRSRSQIRNARICEGVNLPEAIEYLLGELLHIDPMEIVDVRDARVLIRFLSRDENVEIRNAMLDRLSDLARLAWENDITEAAIADYRKLVSDYQVRIRTLAKFGGVVGAGTGGLLGGVVAGVSGALGYLIDPLMLLEPTVGASAGALLDGPAMANAIGKACWGRQHRVFLYVDSLKKVAR
jgi:hypothetical protein